MSTREAAKHDNTRQEETDHRGHRTGNGGQKADVYRGQRTQKCNVEIGSLMVILVHISIALGDYFTLPESTLIICRFKNIVLM